MYSAGRVKVACSLLYPIFNVWRGYCIKSVVVIVLNTISIVPKFIEMVVDKASDMTI